MEETTETKFATDDVRVQLAKDVLTQLGEGKLCGVPRGNWFIGFPKPDAERLYESMHMVEGDLGESAFSTYDDPLYADLDEDDVPASLAAKQDEDYWIVGTRGECFGNFRASETLLALDLQEILLKMPTCEVCAVGSLVVAAARRFDNMKLELLEHRGVFTALEPYFSKGQAMIIEAAYEGDRGGSHSVECLAASKLWPDTATGSYRLQLVMENIIANNGTFVVEEKTS